MSPDSAVYLASALIGALVGGLISLVVSTHTARRERRARYGEAMLDAIGRVHRKLASLPESFGVDRGPADGQSIRFSEEATVLWARTELASTLERRRHRRRAMQEWAMGYHDLLSRGSDDRDGLMALDRRLDVGVYLVIAWVAGHADGRDFARSDEEIARRFGPNGGGHTESRIWVTDGPIA